MDASAFVTHLKGLPSYADQIAHIEHIPPRKAAHGELEEPIHTSLHASLERNGLLPLYSHQAAAVNAVRTGRNVAVVTPAASGKTLSYNVPVLDTILTHKGGRAFYVFPTKALAQDQLRSLDELTRGRAQ